MGLRQRLTRAERSVPQPRVRYRVLFDNGDGTGTDTATGEIIPLGDGADVLRLHWPEDDDLSLNNDAEADDGAT